MKQSALSSTASQEPPLVAHIIFSLGTGGLENGLVNIINRSPPARYRHAIICLTRAERFADRLSAPGVEVIELHKKPGHDLGMYWRLWRELRRLRPAVVHSRNLAALETQVLGLLMPGCVRVHGEHGRDVSDLDGSNRKYQLLRRALSPLIHRFIAVSHDLSQWLTTSVKLPVAKVMQIYDGVDSARFQPRPGLDPLLENDSEAQDHSETQVSDDMQSRPAGMPDDFLPASGRLLLGTVGRLAAVKDQQLILSALQHILQKRPQLRAHLRCILVGDGPERLALETRIDGLALGDCVWLAGDRDDVPALLHCMDIFLLPSLGEGVPNTILEAMATGLPVIATAVGGNPELVEDGVTGLLIPVGDVGALAQAIETLLDDSARREQMGRTAIQRIRQDFDWEQTMANYLQVYDELLLLRAGH